MERLARALSPAENHILIAEGSNMVIESGAQEYLYAPVGLAAFSAEDDRAVVAPVVENMLKARLAYLEGAQSFELFVLAACLGKIGCAAWLAI